jgi:hypothetical protein
MIFIFNIFVHRFIETLQDDISTPPGKYEDFVPQSIIFPLGRWKYYSSLLKEEKMHHFYYLSTKA